MRKKVVSYESAKILDTCVPRSVAEVFKIYYDIAQSRALITPPFLISHSDGNLKAPTKCNV